MALRIERWWPVSLGIIASVVYWSVFRDFKPAAERKDVLGATLSIGAIAVGFLANAKAILFSIDKKRVIVQLKDSRYYGYLVDYLMSAVRWSFVLAIISAAGLVVELGKHERWYSVGRAFWVFVLFAGMASYYRVVHVFGTILRSSDS
jgi:hypothetical protein